MPRVESEPEAYRRVVEAIMAPGLRERQMMGMPSVVADGRMFLGSRGDALLAKLGRERVEELLAAGRAQRFDPSGQDRPMRDWAVLPPPEDDWLALAEEARAYVSR